MASTFELMKNGKIGKSEIFDVEITQIISGLYIYMQMLGEDREREAALINDLRNSLTTIRHNVTKWLEENPPKSEQGDSKNSPAAPVQQLKDSISLVEDTISDIDKASYEESDLWCDNLKAVIAKLESV